VPDLSEEIVLLSLVDSRIFQKLFAPGDPAPLCRLWKFRYPCWSCEEPVNVLEYAGVATGHILVRLQMPLT